MRASALEGLALPCASGLVVMVTPGTRLEPVSRGQCSVCEQVRQTGHVTKVTLISCFYLLTFAGFSLPLLQCLLRACLSTCCVPPSVLGAVAALMGVSQRLASQAGQRASQGVSTGLSGESVCMGGGWQEGAAQLSGSEL